MNKTFGAAVISTIMIFLLSLGAAAAESAKVIKDGTEVAIDYVLTVDGNVFDSTSGKEPFRYTQGKSDMLPALASQLEGLRAGDKKEVNISPKDGYGEINKDAFKEISRTLLTGERQPRVGDMLRIKTTDGNMVAARVQEIRKETMVVDFNHPLAGKMLHFAVTVVDVK